MQIDEILKNIKSREYRVGIVGLGYVGLPLLWTFFKHGFEMIGFDIDESKLELLRSGKSYIKHFDEGKVKKIADSEDCKLTSDFSQLIEVDAILICVPTPLDKYREPDMSYVKSTCEEVAKYLKKGQIVILESTTWPGTSDELITEILERDSGLKRNHDFHIAYSPEREDPGNLDFDTQSIPKIVGGSDESSKDIAVTLYNEVIDRVVSVSSTKVAEASKLLENIFRAVNIALVNEMKVVMDAMDIDIHEVVEAASTKPFGFMKFTPGPGLGGHCIPIDPFYLSWKAREYGLNTRFIELAGEVNTSMPQFVVDKTIIGLNNQSKSVNGSEILILGIAYKPNVDDMRESPSFAIMDKLEGLGARVSYYDNWIPEIPKSREHMNWMGAKSITWAQEIVSSFDCIVIVTDHENVNYKELIEWSDCIVDTRNVLNHYTLKKDGQVLKA